MKPAVFSIFMLILLGSSSVDLGCVKEALADDESLFWSFQPVHSVRVPTSVANAHSASPIDQFILARLAQKGLTRGSPANPRTLLRRATFDLIGLPPTPDEIDAFVADESPDKFSKAIDRLIDSPRYGER